MSRAEEARRRAELAAGHARSESLRAQKLVDAFVQAARERGVAPEPLRATLLSGQSVRTDKTGWYLRKNRSVAVGEDGSYYVLVVPGGLAERFRGVKLTPSPPPLIVGQGGRDGETGPIQDFLDRRLAEG
ncbi:hypothetical protein FHX74_001211 [Friedmanniella endophytica]|uniref:Uncharacterized protein n=1 Tax=Microlunatus kandeliicorticis TaxID=1759536 RepID=A0A7W3P555_9ACTN|nr:hypothetical protein [Microlunatus kandeliicorticis]MBA8793606.1 hypothetical protein [Microlunatus kandeliicorticis]